MRKLVAQLASGALLGKALGFLREIEFARHLGANGVADSFRAAMTTVLLPTQILVSEVLPAVLIPMQRQWRDEGVSRVRASSLGAVLVLLAAVLSAVTIQFADAYVRWLVPGFSDQAIRQTVAFVSVMALCMPAHMLASFIISLEIVSGRPRIASCHSIIQNVGLILGIAVMTMTGDPVHLAHGFLAAFVCMGLAGLFFALRDGEVALTAIRPAVGLSMLWQFMRRARVLVLVPVLNQGNVVLERLIASTLAVGVVACLDYARSLTETAIYLITMPLGYVMLAHTDPDPRRMRGQADRIARAVLAMAVPASVFVSVCATDVVHLVFVRGAFTEEATTLTAAIMRGIGLGLWANVLGLVIVRMLNGSFRNRAAVLAIGAGLLANGAFNALAAPALGPLALGLGEAARGVVILVAGAALIGWGGGFARLMAVAAPAAAAQWALLAATMDAFSTPLERVLVGAGWTAAFTVALLLALNPALRRSVERVAAARLRPRRAVPDAGTGGDGLSRRGMLGVGVGAAGGAMTASATMPVQLPATTPAPPDARGHDVRAFGAIGDGRPHPLRERFRTLAAARRGFAHAVSLDDELDWAATQAAIELARRSGGGTVRSPAGRYVCNRTLVFPANEDRIRPDATAVNWSGDGATATVYAWSHDLGDGAGAVTCAQRMERTSNGFWQDIGLRGPGAGRPRAGRPAASMDGWQWSGRRHMVRCRAEGFFAGIDIVGDQCRLSDIGLDDNWFGLFFSRPNPEVFGDLLIEKLICDRSGHACIGVSEAAVLSQVTFVSCIFASSPYGIWKRTGGSDDNILVGCEFNNCQFERLGNGWIAESGATKVGVVYATRFVNTFFMWGEPWRTADEPRPALWDIGHAAYVTLDGLRGAHNWLPGDRGLFLIGHCGGGITVRGDVERLIRNLDGRGVPLFGPTTRPFHLRLEQEGRWSGHGGRASRPLRRGTAVLLGADGGMHPLHGGSEGLAVGVCVTDGEAGSTVIVADRGVAVPVALETGGEVGRTVVVTGAGVTQLEAGTVTGGRVLGVIREAGHDGVFVHLQGFS